MLIGIDASRAARSQRTGVEEYSYQLIKELAAQDSQNQYRLYSDRELPAELMKRLPPNFEVRVLPFFRLWTQVRLAWELFRNPPDVLWVPASAMPVFHSRRTIVTIHGLEFEYFPEAYNALARSYLRFSTKLAVRQAWRLLVVSENTKQDLIEKYNCDPKKIFVVPNGYSRPEVATARADETLSRYNLKEQSYFIFTGRLEKRKNLRRLIEAFNRFKSHGDYPAKLLLAGKEGFGSTLIKEKISESPFVKDIVVPGYVDKSDFAIFLHSARAMVYPSLYEGFGIPILESLSVETPVICSRISSLPEVGGDAVTYFDPVDVSDIARKMTAVWERLNLPDDQVIARQLAKFSWSKSAGQIKRVLTQ